jgi:hypothetical protein
MYNKYTAHDVVDTFMLEIFRPQVITNTSPVSSSKNLPTHSSSIPEIIELFRA